MKVGFIGLGIMGKPMSMNLLKAGNELVVFDFNETAVAEVVAAGAKGVKSGAEVAAECDTIITMVPNSPHVRAACLGEGGIAETAKPGTVVIDMSSIDPVESKKIGAELAEKGIELMDAPVSGGEPKAIDGTLSVMVGGKKETFDKYYELLMQMAGTWIRKCCKTRKSGNRCTEYRSSIRSTDTGKESRDRSGACISGNPWRSCRFYSS